jgi:hypothetical protein
MNNSATAVQMKGSVVACYASGARVEVWVSSPTGDASDSFTYTIPCHNEEQAKVIAEMWRKVWNIPNYGGQS